MEPYAGVDYSLTLCQLQSQLNTFTMGNPMQGSTLINQSGTLELASVLRRCCQVESLHARITWIHRVHIFKRDETGLVYVPSQLERTQQLYW